MHIFITSQLSNVPVGPLDTLINYGPPLSAASLSRLSKSLSGSSRSSSLQSHTSQGTATGTDDEGEVETACTTSSGDWGSSGVSSSVAYLKGGEAQRFSVWLIEGTSLGIAYLGKHMSRNHITIASNAPPTYRISTSPRTRFRWEASSAECKGRLISPTIWRRLGGLLQSLSGTIPSFCNRQSR